MHSLTSFLLFASPILAQGTIGFGPYFSLGPVGNNAYIQKAVTTLVLPATPSPQEDRQALWPGMGTSGGDLVQALAVSFSDPKANCGAAKGQWCVWASTLQDGTQLGGKQVPASAGAEVLIVYSYNTSTQKIDQTVSLNGSVVSSLSTSSGVAQGFGTAVECQDDSCTGTVPAHKYIDTVITLSAADPNFKNTLATNEESDSGFSTSDGGKTWSVATININQHTFNL